MKKNLTGLQKASVLTGSLLGICVLLFLASFCYTLLTYKPPAPAEPLKTRDDWWQECMNEFTEKPGNYMQACFYYALDMCKENGCVVDPSMEPKK